MPLRVATLNIWNRGGPWEARLVALRAALQAEDVDVLGLQEVVSIEGFDQAALIRRASWATSTPSPTPTKIRFLRGLTSLGGAASTMPTPSASRGRARASPSRGATPSPR